MVGRGLGGADRSCSYYIIQGLIDVGHGHLALGEAERGIEVHLWFPVVSYVSFAKYLSLLQHKFVCHLKGRINDCIASLLHPNQPDRAIQPDLAQCILSYIERCHTAHRVLAMGKVVVVGSEVHPSSVQFINLPLKILHNRLKLSYAIHSI